MFITVLLKISKAKQSSRTPETERKCCCQSFSCNLLVYHYQNKRSQSTTIFWSFYRRGDPTNIKDFIWKKIYSSRHTIFCSRDHFFGLGIQWTVKDIWVLIFFQNRHQMEALTLTDQGDQTDQSWWNVRYGQHTWITIKGPWGLEKI